MKIKNDSNFIPSPAGIHNAICVDEVDLGYVDTQYGPKHKCRLVWEIEELIPEGPMKGKRFLVMKQYGASIGKKSTLRADLKNWRGRDFTEEEAKEFDLEKVVGVIAQLVVTHNVHEGTTYANITAVIKGKQAMQASGDYTRVKDRPGYKAPVMDEDKAHTQANVPDLEESDIPF